MRREPRFVLPCVGAGRERTIGFLRRAIRRVAGIFRTGRSAERRLISRIGLPQFCVLR